MAAKGSKGANGRGHRGSFIPIPSRSGLWSGMDSYIIHIDVYMYMYICMHMYVTVLRIYNEAYISRK